MDRGRPEGEIHPASPEHVRIFVQQLRDLREECGLPGYRKIAKLGNASFTSLSKATKGPHMPTWELTRAFVVGCLGSTGRDEEVQDVLVGWRSDWDRASRPSPGTAHDQAGHKGPVADEGPDPDASPGPRASNRNYEGVPADTHIDVVTRLASKLRQQKHRMLVTGFLGAIGVGLLVATVLAASRVGGTATSPEPIPMRHLWQAGTADNLLTTESRWDIRPGTTSTDGYHFGYVDSYVMSANAGPFECLVPLVRFQGARRNGRVDQATTADPTWIESGTGLPEGYEQQVVVGYVYPPDRPRPPGTRPLYRLYSEDRGDYFTTSNDRWSGPAGRKKGYVVQRLEGYVLVAGFTPPYCAKRDVSRAIEHIAGAGPFTPLPQTNARF